MTTGGQVRIGSRSRAHTREPVAIGPAAAGSAWLAVLVMLNLTSHPIIAGATFAGLAVLAIRCDQRRLLVLSLVVGACLLLVVPGVALVDGSFSFSYGAGAWQAPTGPEGVLLAAASALRVPAQVLAAVLLLLVPGAALLAAASRLSPNTALLGALAARLRPLLGRDARLVRDELASRGLRMGRQAPIAERAGAVVSLWEAIVSGLLDRAFQTAAALDARGFGLAHPESGELRHPDLHVPVRRDRSIDAALVAIAGGLVATTAAARSTGALAAPAMQVFGGIHEPITPAVLVLATGGLLLGVLPLRARPTAPAAILPDAGEARTSDALSNRARGAVTGRLALVLEQVGMQYPAAIAPSLVDASLQVAPGELVVVTGASGSGKSTLLDVVTGVAPRTTGGRRTGIVRLGEHVLGATVSTERGRVAAVFQDPESQVLAGRVAEEVAFGPRHAGLALEEVEARTLDALDRLGIRHLARRDCATLSGGELQRVLLAAALALDPVLLVLDEPTSQVDATSERRFWDAVDDARRTRGIAVVAAEHRLDFLRTRADRVVVMANGRVTADVRVVDADSVARSLLADPYVGLVPAPAATAAAARLQVRVDRLVVGEGTTEARSLLRGLSVTVPAGAIVTLEGPNGAGKSTLLRAIRGLHPSPIDVRVDGHARGEVGASVRQVAFLSQGAGALLPGRTVRHAIEQTCRRLDLDVAAAHTALAAAGLADRIDSHPSELSVGERQRLALVAATAHRPHVWLLDEPTRGMDAHARRWVACHLLAHAAAGGVVLVATHDSALAAAVATHRLRLDLQTGPTLLPVRRDAAGQLVADPSPTSQSTAVVVDGGVG
jgi:energy-coupling factor transport system ATP-binding protein